MRKIPQQEKESWPEFRGFGLANYKKINEDRQNKNSFIEYLEVRGQKTRSLFDKIFEYMFKTRIDGAGNWLVAFSLCIASCSALIMHRRYNDKLRLQMDDILTYRDQLQIDVATIKQKLDDHKQ